MTGSPTPTYIRVMFRMIRQQPIRYSFALLLWVSIWTMPILVGLVSAEYFDALTQGMEVNTLTLLVAALLAYALTRSVFIFMAMRNHGSLLFRAAATITDPCSSGRLRPSERTYSCGSTNCREQRDPARRPARW